MSFTKAVFKKDPLSCATVATIVRRIVRHGGREKRELETTCCPPMVVALVVIPGNQEIALLTYVIPAGKISSR